MNTAFEHIEQARFLLSRIFESGFIYCGNVSDEIESLKNQAEELSLNKGADLLSTLDAELLALRGGQGSITAAAVKYSNLITYYQIVSDMLILETMSKK